MSQERQEDDWWFTAAVTEQSESFLFFLRVGLNDCNQWRSHANQVPKDTHRPPFFFLVYIDTKNTLWLSLYLSLSLFIIISSWQSAVAMATQVSKPK